MYDRGTDNAALFIFTAAVLPFAEIVNVLARMETAGIRMDLDSPRDFAAKLRVCLSLRETRIMLFAHNLNSIGGEDTRCYHAAESRFV